MNLVESFSEFKEGKNIVIATSHNTLRALVKYLENIAEDQVATLEIGTGEAYVYTLDEAGKIVNKEIRGANENKGKV